MKRICFLMAVACAWNASLAWGQKAGAPPADEAAIKKSVAAYVAAFNKRDAKALAALWSPEAVYTNRVTGEQVSGSKAIADQFVALFQAEPTLKLDVATDSIQLLSPNVAVEQGAAKFLAPGNEPEEVNYTAVYVKRGGQWLLDRLTDAAPEAAPSHKHLQQLEWMVGSWVDQDEDVTIETDCEWTKNRAFLTRSFKVAAGDLVQMSGMQVIGWDPTAKQIRSWTFDSDGGFAEANWTYSKDRWFIQNKGVLADGRKATMVNVIKPVDKNSFTWQTIERTTGGELLPNIDEVVIVRKAPAN